MDDLRTYDKDEQRMPKQLKCHCVGTPGCKLCQGTGKYEYESGPLGWQPFTCPNCEGKKVVADATVPVGTSRCKTCAGKGRVDPANPPSTSMWDALCKIFMGA